MINLNILTSRREYYLPLIFHFIKRMKEENRKKVHVNILAFGDMSRFDNEIDTMESLGVSASAIRFVSEYMEKAVWAVDQNVEYTAKIDEDTVVSNHVLDYIIENIRMLDDPQNLVISPVVTNGIPTPEMFLEQFATEEQKQRVYSLFLQTRLGPLWGADYTFLNRHTVDAKEWKPEEFYASVAGMRHHYKGIHPLRVNAEAQLTINQIVSGQHERFFGLQEFSMVQNDHPYLCNNLFFIRNDTWRKIFVDRSLWFDGFDEVPLSEYKQRNGLKWLFVKNGWCQHFAWNTVYGHPWIQQAEEPFVDELKKRVM